LSVDRQGFMVGRSNICVAEPREPLAVPAECQFGRPAENGDLLAFGVSDMTKIKSNLVTFVTDNFLLLRIVGNTDFLRAGGKNGGAAHRKRKRKRRRCVTVEQQRGLAMVRENPRRRSQIQNVRLDGTLVGDLIATGTP
jgi:hypothetical protein